MANLAFYTTESFKEVQTVESFRTDGRIVVMSPTTILTKCGPAVEMVQLKRAVKREQPKNQELSESIEMPDDDISYQLDQQKDCLFKSTHTVLGHYEIQDDVIVTFDACATTYTMITAHKSGSIRKWNLRTGESVRTMHRSPNARPVDHIEINRVPPYFNSFQDLWKGQIKAEVENETIKEAQKRINKEKRVSALEKGLIYAVVAGSEVAVYCVSGDSQQQSKTLTLPGVNKISIAKWDYSSSAFYPLNHLIVADSNIYMIECGSLDRLADGLDRFHEHTLKHHNGNVTGIEWCCDDAQMISASSDRTYAIWSRPELSGPYCLIKTYALKEPIISTCMLNATYLCILTAKTISHVHVVNGSVSGFKKNTWWGDEAITGAYRAFPDEEQMEEVIITNEFGLLYYAELTPPLGDKSQNGFELQRTTKEDVFIKRTSVDLKPIDEYQACFNHILAIKIWEQSDGSIKIVVANNTPHITVYEGGKFTILDGHEASVLTLATTRDYLISGSKDKKILVWKANTQLPHLVVNAHQAEVICVCAGGSGENIIFFSVSEDLSLIKWMGKVDSNICDQVIRASAHGKEIYAVDFSPNEKLVVTASRDKTAKLWDATNLHPIGTFSGHTKTVCDVRFSKWDKRVITSSRDTTARIWCVETLQCLMTLQGHEGTITQAFFVNQGLQAISSGVEGSWRLWDLITGTCVCTVESSEDSGNLPIDSTPNASTVVTGSETGTIKEWKDNTTEVKEEKLKAAKQKIQDTQYLTNSIAKCDWEVVLVESINLERPSSALQAIRGLGADQNKLNKIISKLPEEAKKKLAEYATKWTTNKTTMFEGYSIIKALTTDKSKTKLLQLKLSGYEDRHLNRLQKREEHLALMEYIAG